MLDPAGRISPRSLLSIAPHVHGPASIAVSPPSGSPCRNPIECTGRDGDDSRWCVFVPARWNRNRRPRGEGDALRAYRIRHSLPCLPMATMRCIIARPTTYLSQGDSCQPSRAHLRSLVTLLDAVQRNRMQTPVLNRNATAATRSTSTHPSMPFPICTFITVCISFPHRDLSSERRQPCRHPSVARIETWHPVTKRVGRYFLRGTVTNETQGRLGKIILSRRVPSAYGPAALYRRYKHGRTPSPSRNRDAEPTGRGLRRPQRDDEHRARPGSPEDHRDGRGTKRRYLDDPGELKRRRDSFRSGDRDCGHHRDHHIRHERRRDEDRRRRSRRRSRSSSSSSTDSDTSTESSDSDRRRRRKHRRRSRDEDKDVSLAASVRYGPV